MKKFKLIYIYAGGFLLAAVLIYVLSRGNNSTGVNNSAPSVNSMTGDMPQDQIHKGLNGPMGQAPDKNNVMASIRQHLDELKQDAINHPADTLRMRKYADFLTSAHQNDQAIIYYNKILSINPRRTDILSSLVFIYFYANNLDAAEIYLNKILAVDKNNVEAMYNLGVISANKGDRAAARKIWTKIINNYPSSPMSEKAKSSIARL